MRYKLRAANNYEVHRGNVRAMADPRGIGFRYSGDATIWCSRHTVGCNAN